MLVIRKLHSHFPRRIAEWGISYMLLSWGLILLVFPSSFSQAASDATAVGSVYRSWAALAPQIAWGMAATTIAIVRLSALYVNGAHYNSPFLRTLGAILSSLVWFFATVGVLRADMVTTAVGIYPWLLVGDLYAAYVASGDWWSAKQARKVAHGI